MEIGIIKLMPLHSQLWKEVSINNLHKKKKHLKLIPHGRKLLKLSIYNSISIELAEIFKTTHFHVYQCLPNKLQTYQHFLLFPVK